jgi:Ca2+-binding EF-hand superfamily protein
MPPKTGAAAGGKTAALASAKSKKKATTISDADARNLQKTFSDYDADGSGEISLIELQHFFDRSSPDLKGAAADFISTLDKDGDGKITFLELLKEMYPMTPSKQLNDVYRKFYPEAVAKISKCSSPSCINPCTDDILTLGL